MIRVSLVKFVKNKTCNGRFVSRYQNTRLNSTNAFLKFYNLLEKNKNIKRRGEIPFQIEAAIRAGVTTEDIITIPSCAYISGVRGGLV